MGKTAYEKYIDMLEEKDIDWKVTALREHGDDGGEYLGCRVFYWKKGVLVEKFFDKDDNEINPNEEAWKDIWQYLDHTSY